jgi:hypothetical protein
MKIDDFYRGSASVTLNGSIAALIPAIIIGVGNLYYFQNKQIMLLTIPFIIYSLISFQIYLFRMKQSILIGRGMLHSGTYNRSLFDARHLVVVFMNHQQACVHLFFSDGNQAGVIKKYRKKGFFQPTIYALYNGQNEVIGYYKIKQSKTLIIEVYDRHRRYSGCYEKFKKRKEILDESGFFIGSVEGSKLFMDERIFNTSRQQVGGLRRGLMPVEWSTRFPNPNTPVLSLSENLSEKDKLVRMSFLINEYFIER